MNKREQQRLRKQEKQQAAERKQQTRGVALKVGLYVVAPVFVLVVLFTLFSRGPTYSPVELAESDHILGDRSTPVTITVYADFQCPACAQEQQLMSRAWPSINDQAHLVFRHFPITSSHPNAWRASLYAEAAARQDRFWEMHDYLFLNQNLWAGSGNPMEEWDSYALELSLDIDRLHADMDSDEVIQKVRNDQRSGSRSGVRGTPTIFINGNLSSFSTVSRLVELVDSAGSASGG
ncbi:MAG: thioredoxin domain-containing protein [Gammaproteobacteria bacterium]|nr:thioredoxin domain-containing protein [Pseudomonadales bacterium]MCP5346631.1 thioredoxin domain-containing protein [Pseudomonadales bacterium]